MNYSDLKKVVDDIADYAKDIRECAQAYANNASTTLDRDYSVKDIVFCINEMEKCKQEIANIFGLTEKEANDEISKMIDGIEVNFCNAKACLKSAISEKDQKKKISRLNAAWGLIRNFNGLDDRIQYLMARISVGGMENDN
jgi:hypothetical protein